MTVVFIVSENENSGPAPLSIIMDAETHIGTPARQYCRTGTGRNCIKRNRKKGSGTSAVLRPDKRQYRPADFKILVIIAKFVK